MIGSKINNLLINVTKNLSHNMYSYPSAHTTAVLNDCYSELMGYTVLAYSYWASFHDKYGFLLVPCPLTISTATVIQKPKNFNI